MNLFREEIVSKKKDKGGDMTIPGPIMRKEAGVDTVEQIKEGGPLPLNISGFAGSEVNIKILNLLGKAVYQKDVSIADENAQIRLDIEGLPKGMYGIVVSDGKTRATTKVSISDKTIVSDGSKARQIRQTQGVYNKEDGKFRMWGPDAKGQDLDIFNLLGKKVATVSAESHDGLGSTYDIRTLGLHESMYVLVDPNNKEITHKIVYSEK